MLCVWVCGRVCLLLPVPLRVVRERLLHLRIRAARRDFSRKGSGCPYCRSTKRFLQKCRPAALVSASRQQTGVFSRLSPLHPHPLPLTTARTRTSCAASTTGYSPFLHFDVDDMDTTVVRCLSLGATLDGPIKYPAHGKVASVSTAFLSPFRFIPHLSPSSPHTLRPSSSPVRAVPNFCRIHACLLQTSRHAWLLLVPVRFLSSQLRSPCGHMVGLFEPNLDLLLASGGPPSGPRSGSS